MTAKWFTIILLVSSIVLLVAFLDSENKFKNSMEEIDSLNLQLLQSYDRLHFYDSSNYSFVVDGVVYKPINDSIYKFLTGKKPKKIYTLTGEKVKEIYGQSPFSTVVIIETE